jgi:hypothetical protein
MINSGQFASSPCGPQERSRLIPGWDRSPHASNHLMRAGAARSAHQINERQRFIGANAMRSFLVLGLLITLCASASAATVHHSRHVIVHPSHGYAVPGSAYAAPRPPVHYDDTPSYNDPSKFGGGTAL